MPALNRLFNSARPRLAGVIAVGFTTALLLACSQIDGDRHSHPREARPMPADTAQEVVVTGSRITTPGCKRAELRALPRGPILGSPPVLDQLGPAASTERYRHRDENDFKRLTEQSVSTFSIDVDSASYANARRVLNAGVLPAADAGEIGAGHTVTALYEIVLEESVARTVDPLRYDRGHTEPTEDNSNELAYLKLRYKLPEPSKSTLVQQSILRKQITDLDNTSNNFRWSASAAAFGQLLAGSDWGQYSFDDVYKLGKGARGDDPHGYRSDMLKLVKMVDTLKLAHSTQPVDDNPTIEHGMKN